jgi:hypothetical protein
MDEAALGARVAAAVARFLDGARYDESAARADVAPDLNAPLARLIAMRLAGEEVWSRWWTVDDAWPESMAAVDDLTADVAGIAWMLGDSSLGVRQPFKVRVRLPPTRDAVEGWTLWFGDADVGLAPPERSHRRQVDAWPAVDQWVFVIEG